METLRMTYEQAQDAYRTGAISAREWRRYVLAWTWSAPRFSEVQRANTKQERFWARRGPVAMACRQQRVRNAIKRTVESAMT